MNGEVEFAYRVRGLLNRGTEELDRKVAGRLVDVRNKALTRQRARVAGLGLAGVGNLSSVVFGSNLRATLAALALVVGVAFAYYWNRYEEAIGYADIDSEILADEVPFNAYLDQGFQEWLNRRAQEPDEVSSPSSSQ